MYRITIHCEVPSTELLDAIAKHVGHIEVAIDYLEPEPPARAHHPIIEHVIDAEAETRKLTRRQGLQARRDAQRKRDERIRWARVAKVTIHGAACPVCHQPIGQPCKSPNGTLYGYEGFTHAARQALVVV